MLVKLAWSSIYLQFSSFNFLCSGLFGDILCLRFFLTWAYLWLFVNAVTGFPSWGSLAATDVFVLHIDVLCWSVVTLYVHASKFLGIVLNERAVSLPPESLPLWNMLYRNGGLSQLLFQQFVWPRFELVKLHRGDVIEDKDDAMYIVLDGVAQATVTIGGTTNQLSLSSGEVIHVRHLHLFESASTCAAFADQTVRAVVQTDEMQCYRCQPKDVHAIATKPQTKQAYQGLLIFVLTRIAERAILSQDGQGPKRSTDSTASADQKYRNPAFLPLQPWEEAPAVASGSGKALQFPLKHFAASLRQSFRPPWPILKWIPGLRHAALPAPHYVPDKSIKAKASSMQDELHDTEQGVPNTEKKPLLS